MSELVIAPETCDGVVNEELTPLNVAYGVKAPVTSVLRAYEDASTPPNCKEFAGVPSSHLPVPPLYINASPVVGDPI